MDRGCRHPPSFGVRIAPSIPPPLTIQRRSVGLPPWARPPLPRSPTVPTAGAIRISDRVVCLRLWILNHVVGGGALEPNSGGTKLVPRKRTEYFSHFKGYIPTFFYFPPHHSLACGVFSFTSGRKTYQFFSEGFWRICTNFFRTQLYHDKIFSYLFPP